jgi:alkaline phosphatase D
MLRLASYLAGLVSLAASSYAQTLPNGVACGDTTQTTSVLWTRSTAVGSNVTFEFSTDPDFATIQGTFSVPVTDANAAVKTQVRR